MTQEQAQRVKQLFDTAFELAPDNREGFLTEACNGDEELHDEVGKLLRLLNDIPEFLETPPLINDSTTAASAINSDAALGRRIGAYMVIRELGRGGMGAVYLAHRADDVFHKQVAIKLVWPGLGNEEIIRRFQQERQILAHLEHPNIAHLLDGGITDEGWHYLVMEYIEGVPITQYCQEFSQSIEARLRLFRAVCEAVQFAHQNLIIHRDLKPGNILVTLEGVPKLLDFGIAKLLANNEQALDLTRTQLPLTPEYASPEQFNHHPITTATDVYSLGVVLYEILTGRKPYHFKSSLLHEVAQVVLEKEPDDPNLNEDLGNIVLMAMRKEPQLRYQSVEQFNADVQRYLEGKTVLARKATTSYRVRKFVRRNRITVLLAALLLFTLLSVAVIALRQAIITSEQAREQRRQLYATQMTQAMQDWELGNLSRMRETLDSWLPQDFLSGQEDLRGFEWHYLWRLRNPSAVIITQPHGENFGNFGFYDGDNYVLGSNGSFTRLWDVQTGELLNTIVTGSAQHSHPLAREKDFPLLISDGNEVQVINLRTGQVQYSFSVTPYKTIMLEPQSMAIITGHEDGTVKFWETPTGKLQSSLQCQSSPVDNIRLAFDLQKLFTRAGPNKWLMRDLKHGTSVQIHTETVRAVPQFSANNKYFIIAESNIAVRVFVTATGKELKRITLASNNILSATFTPDSQHLLITGTDSIAQLYRLPSLEQVAVFRSNSHWLRSACVSPDGRLLMAISGDHTVKLWDISTQKEMAVIKGHEAQIIGVEFSHDGRKAMSWSVDGTARIWDVGQLLIPDHLTGHTNHIFAVAFAPDNKTLASASKDHSIRLWDVNTGQLLKLLNGHSSWVFSVAFAPDGKTLVSGSQDNTARLWNIAEGQELRHFYGHTESVRSVAFAPDGRRLATASSDGTARVWEVETDRELFKLTGHKGEVFGVAFAPNGSQIITAGHDKTARLWDAATGQELKQLRGHTDAVWGAQFSPDGSLIATASADRAIKLWDARTGIETATIQGHANDILSIAWSPDGTRLATASNDNTVRCWNVKLAMEVLMLRQHDEQVWSVAFAPDGKTLASGSWDKTIRLWRTALPQPGQ